MLMQINSGVGPKECERACYLYCEELLKEFPKLIFVEANQTDKECYQSVLLYCDVELDLEGTVQWICQSPFRKHHKRKNWFIDISILKEDISLDNTNSIRYEIIHSRGKGGQNINKVATGVRAIHIPTGMSITSMDQRSQLQNKKIATERLLNKINEFETQMNGKVQYYNWNQHHQIVRGQPYRVYEGEDFKLLRKER